MNHEELKDAIASGGSALSQRFDATQIDQMASLLGELERWSVRINLTAIRRTDEMVSGHVLDSLSVRPLLHGDSVIDIGTGAGFPGLPLAIAEPGRQFLLLDSNGKKISFVRHMIAELGLSNADAVKTRVEDYAPGHPFDTVIARALAATPRILQLAGHLLDDDGVLLALKGQYPAEELDELIRQPAGWTHNVTELKVPGLDGHSRHVVSVRKEKASPR